MAEDKKGFLLYADIIYTIEHLTNEEKGLLFQHLLEYVNDMNPVLEDRLLLIAWKPIERQLKRDLKKYECKKEERSIAGQMGNLKRYHEDLYNSVKSEEITLKQALAIVETRKASLSEKELAKLAVNDTVTVNDTVNDIVNDSEINKRFALDFLNGNSQYESFCMQNKSKVNEWDNMLNSFNDQMDLELAQNKISFEPNQLLPRLSKYCRSWVSNQKPKVKKQSSDPLDNITF